MSNSQEQRQDLPEEVQNQIEHQFNSIPIVLMSTGISIMGITLVYKEPKMFLSLLHDLLIQPKPEKSGFFKRFIFPGSVGLIIGYLSHDYINEIINAIKAQNNNNN